MSVPLVNEPGLFSSHDDKALADAIRQLDASAIDEIGRRVPRLALASATISGFVKLQHDDDAGAQRSLDQAQEAFSSRIVALAEAHDLLTRENWEGADLHEVAARVAEPHGGAARFELGGPAVRLSPKTALSLSMALHELATNAVKYGALSMPEGRIRIAWELVPDPGAARLDLTWTERDGPPVTPPTGRGFGSRLIERGLAAELSGSATIDFQPAGVVCRIRALLDA